MAKGAKKRIRPTPVRAAARAAKRRIRPTPIRMNKPGEAAALLGKNLRELKRLTKGGSYGGLSGAYRRHGGGEKKKKRISATLVSSPAPSKAALSSPASAIVRNMANMLSRYNVDDTAFERTTAALEKQLRANDKVRDKREDQLTEALVEAQKEVDFAKEQAKEQRKMAKVKAKSSKSKSKGKSAGQAYANPNRNCGSKKVVRVKAYTRCGVK